MEYSIQDPVTPQRVADGLDRLADLHRRERAMGAAMTPSARKSIRDAEAALRLVTDRFAREWAPGSPQPPGYVVCEGLRPDGGEGRQLRSASPSGAPELSAGEVAAMGEVAIIRRLKESRYAK